MSKVVTYKNDERHCYCHIKLDNGKRIMISISTAPKPKTKVYQLALGGLIPIRTIWEYNPTMAGGYYAYVKKMMEMFLESDEDIRHALDVIRDRLLSCSSIDEVRLVLLEAEESVSDL